MFDIIIKRPQPIITAREVRKLDVRDGDIVVFKCDGQLKPAAAKGFRAALEEIIGGYGLKVRVIILDAGMSVHTVLHNISEGAEDKTEGQR